MQKANQSIGPHDREEHKRTEPKSIKLLFFPLCVLAQHKIYFKLFSNCWLKPRVSCLVCYATQWGRQPVRQAVRQAQKGDNNSNNGQEQTQTEDNKHLVVQGLNPLPCVCGKFAKCFHDILYNLCKWGKKETEWERERLLCSVHSYQQISKRPSSQRLIIPLSLSMNANWIWQNHEKFEIRILFVAFFFGRIICQRDILPAPHWVWLICTWWELETAGLERLSRSLSSVHCIGDFSMQCLHKCLSCWVNTQSKRVATTTTRGGSRYRDRERGDNATL